MIAFRKIASLGPQGYSWWIAALKSFIFSHRFAFHLMEYHVMKCLMSTERWLNVIALEVGAHAVPLWAPRIQMSIQTFNFNVLRPHTHQMASRLFSWRSAYSQRSPIASSTTENSWIYTVGFPHYSGAKHSVLTAERGAGAPRGLLLLLLKAATG